MVDENARIELNAAVLDGKPVIRGTRLSVEFILTMLAEGLTYDDILRNYSEITIEDIQACLRYASDCLHDEPFPPVGA